MKKLIIILSLFLCIQCTNIHSKPELTQEELEDVDSILGEGKYSPDSIRKVDSLQKAATADRLLELKKNFIYTYDEFKKRGWYVHKNQTDNLIGSSKMYIRTMVNNVGYIYLEDQYHASDWLFHEAISVKIGDSIYRSAIIQSYEDENRTKVSDGIWEWIQYTSERDNGIIKAIAENTGKTIKVRFEGKDYYDELTLSKNAKTAIKESLELSDLIKIASKA